MSSLSSAGTSAVHFPHELASVPNGVLVSVAGKLSETSRPNHWVLADAFAECEVQLRVTVTCAPGNWVLLRGLVQRADGRLRLVDAQLLSSHPGTSHCDGQFTNAKRKARNLRARAIAKTATRQFFEGREYLEVSTPVRVAAPGTDVYLEPQASGDQWLITSPEFHLKRLVAGGLPRLFEFATCTRRDEVGAWHQPEFTMLEWYCAFQTFESLMTETEQLVRRLAEALGAPSPLTVGGRDVNIYQPFDRLTVADAFATFAGVRDVATLAECDEDRYFQLMVDEVEPGLARIPRPVLLTHYPLSQAALSAPSTEYPGFAERFELFIGGVEICNGYGELTCVATQRARFEEDVRRRAARGLPFIPPDEGLLSALEEGLPPCTGNAVGFDRLLAVLLEQPLEDVVAFAKPVPR